MKTIQREVRSWDDLIFEDRNHAYGAYAVRKAYASNVGRATVITLGLAAAVLSFSLIGNGKITLPDTPPPQPPPNRVEREVRVITDPPLPPAQTQRRRGDLPPVAAANPVNEVIPPTNAELTQPGSETGTDTEPTVGAEYGFGEVATIEVPVAVEEDKVWDRTEVAAQYKGGMEAMIKFISRNTKYPPVPRRMGIQGTVYVSFVIGKGGEVMDAAIIKGIDTACDAEALRVINLMKGWSPGLQGGVPVKVRMVLPITFKLAE